MRPHCPQCGEPCEDDGDRYYADDCFCGWRSERRKASNERTAQRLAANAAKRKAELEFQRDWQVQEQRQPGDDELVLRLARRVEDFEPLGLSEQALKLLRTAAMMTEDVGRVVLHPTIRAELMEADDGL